MLFQLNTGDTLLLNSGEELQLNPINLPDGEYWLVVDLRDEDHPTGLNEELRSGYQTTLDRISYQVTIQEPSGVIFRNPGTSTLGGYRIDGYWAAKNVQPFAGEVVDDLLRFNYWELDDPPVPRKPGGGRFPIWLWVGPFSQEVRDDLDAYPISTRSRIFNSLKGIWRNGFEGIIIEDASDPTITEATKSADIIRKFVGRNQRQLTSISGWPRITQRHLQGLPVILEWADRADYPNWTGHGSPNAMPVDSMGPVLIVADEDIDTFADNCEAIINAGASVGVPESLWNNSFVIPAPPAVEPFADLTVGTLTIGNSTMSLTLLTSVEEMRQMLGEDGVNFALEDVSSPSTQSTIITDCIEEASEHVYTYMSARYTMASIAQSRMMRRHATYGALLFLLSRRNQPQSDTYLDLWNRAVEMMRELAIGNIASLKPPGLVEIESSGMGVVNFSHQPGPHPYGESVRFRKDDSTVDFPGARPRRWGNTIGINGEL